MVSPIEPGPAENMDAIVRHLENLRELLIRMDAEFFQDTVRHLGTILQVLRVRRAVERNAARSASVT